MQKSLADGRLPGVLSRAEYPANPFVANDPARVLAPGTDPGSTPSKLCLHKYRLLQTVLASHQSFSKHVRTLRGVNPWQNVFVYFLKIRFLFVKKIKILKFNN